MNGAHEQNPYRAPRCAAAATERQTRRVRDLVLAGLSLGVAYGATAGALIAACPVAVELLIGYRGWRQGDAASALMTVTLPLVAASALGACMGAIPGAGLGAAQGVWVARSPVGGGRRLIRRATLCWSLTAVAACLFVEHAGRGPMGLMLLTAGVAGALSAARMAVRLNEIDRMDRIDAMGDGGQDDARGDAP